MQTKIDDSIFAVSAFSSVCNFCVHFDMASDRNCAAFTEKIPLEIWEGRNPHTAPFPGDHGLQFEDARKLSIAA